jgi:pyruvate,orthophosphate dikinase
MSIVKLPGSPAAERRVLGGKAWSIQRMQNLGVPVPPAFVITTEVCERFYANGRRLPDDLKQSLPAAMRWLEETSGRGFGDGTRPLLVSVRSGASISMPGMMDTLLNLGINAEVEQALARQSRSAEFAGQLSSRFQHQYRRIVGIEAPGDPWQQLHAAIGAVFDSWQSQRAKDYRRDRNLPNLGGTAVTVQTMVFGNLDDNSGTGVMFTRDPISGDPNPYGEWLLRGQGEDLVSGQTTPQPLELLARQLPGVYAELLEVGRLIERDCRDVQDIEFTVESGKLWLLQARAAKRSPHAAIRLAVELQQSGLINTIEALDRITPDQVATVLRPGVQAAHRALAKVLARGHLACPGLVSGTLVTDVLEAEQRAEAGENIILARRTTDPEDVHAMTLVGGVLTELGGTTSHAAVVSREIGVPCIVGCGEGSLMPLNGRQVTMNAQSGEVLDGELRIDAASAATNPYLAQLAAWARAENPHHGNLGIDELLQARKKTRNENPSSELHPETGSRSETLQ